MNKHAPKTRCHWCNEKNPLYVAYHDHEWGVRVHSDSKLFEILLLETFQAGLSWECVLNKRNAFRLAFDNFNPQKIAAYTEPKLLSLQQNKAIIRNRLKISAAVKNAQAFLQIQNEFGSFAHYIWSFTQNQVIHELHQTRSSLSDSISKDLTKRGMKFVGTTIIYSYLQAIGIISSHEKTCFLYSPPTLHHPQ
jgi:DNA-3-methyladenine glycosylase I